MSEDTTSRTIQILSNVVKKTPLNHKLLSRPPFRYLHDLISEIINNTQFAKDLYTVNEFVSANVTEKEAKLTYLQKLVDVTALVSGTEVKAKPAKIVAGLEPDDTNALLQFIGELSIKGADTSDAVRQVLGGTGSSAKPVPKSTPKPSSREEGKSSSGTAKKKSPEEKAKSSQSLSRKSSEQLKSNTALDRRAAAVSPKTKAAVPGKSKYDPNVFFY
jgi:TRAF3-interacting protein 1